jgi:tRNA threonylcarbamoyladenosine biosynthesis protein TsaB
MISLVLEASTYAGSAALLEGSSLLASRSVAMRGKDHEALMASVGELLDERGLAPDKIGRVVCGAGPGSFTSLRIAASIAKGLSVATGARLLPVSSLALLVGSVGLPRPGRYIAVMDAMRGESYVQEFVVDHLGQVDPAGLHSVRATDSVDQLAVDRGAVALGPARLGAAAVAPHARGAVNLTNMIEATEPADLAAWEPLYGRLAEAQVKWELSHGRPLEVV